MYDISTQNIEKGRIVWLILFSIGLIFLVILVNIFLFGYFKFKKMDSETLSTNVVVDSHYDDEDILMYSKTYYYSVDGISYSCASKSSSSTYPNTDNKTIYYESSNPKKCVSEEENKINYILLLFVILPLGAIVSSIINFRKINKRLDVIKRLNQTGKLVKNLPYHLVDTGIIVNNRNIKKIVVDYTLPSGSIVKLSSDFRYDNKTSDSDGLVDLVIDEKDCSNYFIDFEINRITGNLKEDYYNKDNRGEC